MRNTRLAQTVALMAIATLLTSCGGGPDPNAPGGSPAAGSKSKKVETVEVEGQEYKDTLDLPGGATVEAIESAWLYAKMAGYVKTIAKVGEAEVDIGTEVAVGTVLAELDVPEVVAERKEKEAMAKAAAALVVSATATHTEAQQELVEKEALQEFRKTDYDNYQNLRRQNATTDQLVLRAKAQYDAAVAAVGTAKAHVKTAEAKLEAAKSNVKVAEAGVERLKAMEEYGKITAPFAGRITSRKVHRGTFVRSASSNSGAMPLFEITRIDKVRIVANVPSRLAAKGAMDATQGVLGKEAVLHSINGLPGLRLRVGKLTHSSKSLDPDSRSLRVEVHYTNPKPGEQGLTLERGMFGSITVTLNSWTKENPLTVVPATAMGTDDEGNPEVLVVAKGKDGKWTYQKRGIRVVFNDALNVGFTHMPDKPADAIQPGEHVIAEYDKGLDGQAAAAPQDGDA